MIKYPSLIIFLCLNISSPILFCEEDQDPILIERERQITIAINEEKNEAKAHGDSKVLFKLGMDLFSQGSKHYSEALAWLTASSDKGYAPAEYQLALFYMLGLAVPKDLPKAVALLKASAKQGNDRALLQLGEMLAHGNDALPKDIDLAKEYLNKAIELGNTEAKVILEDLQNNPSP